MVGNSTEIQKQRDARQGTVCFGQAQDTCESEAEVSAEVKGGDYRERVELRD